MGCWAIIYCRLFFLDGPFPNGSHPNGSISVLNACRLKSPDGELDTFEGYAFRPNEKEEGKLKVIFNSIPRFLQFGEANCEKL